MPLKHLPAIDYLPFPELQEILDAFTAGVVIIDCQGLTTAMNTQAASVLGVNKIKVRNMSLHEFLPQSYREVVRILRSGKMTASLPVEELDNCMLQVTPLPSRKGGLLTILDFRLWPNLSGYENALDPFTPYLKAIFESSSDGISVANEKGVLVAVNAASARLTGMTPSELVGRHVKTLVEEGYADTYIAMDVIKEKTTISRLATYHKSGCQLLLTGTPFFDRHRNVKLVIINERDLTRLSKLKDDLKRVKEVNAKIRAELNVLKIAQYSNDTGFVAQSPGTKELLRVALKLASVGAGRILITGESGTGKGLLAKFIHNNSLRLSKPFVHVNCAALPEQLLEAELFGYEKGAFTGAAPGGKAGLFEVAQDGTVFLDEIGEMPLAIQSKLLTFLDDQVFMRVGGNKPLKVNCAIIAATNQNLKEMVAQKMFRADLYYRLNTFSLIIPPLRERFEDLQHLATIQLACLNRQYNLTRSLDRLSWKSLYKHQFPGNVRELLDILKKAVILSDHDELGEYLSSIIEADQQLNIICLPQKKPPGEAIDLRSSLEKTEREALEQAFKKGHSTREMAQMLNISQSSISRKLRRYGISPVSGPQKKDKNKKKSINFK